MSETDEGTASNQTAEEKEIAKKMALLNAEQRQRYDRAIDRRIDRNGSVTPQFQLGVVKTLLQPIPSGEQNRQIKEYERREDQRAFLNDQRIERESAAGVKQPSQKPEAQVSAQNQEPNKEQQQPTDPMSGVRPHEPKRDYGELRETHRQVAALQKQDESRGAATGSAPTALSMERLQQMEKGYSELRRAEKLEPTPAELRERDKLTKDQAQIAEKLDRAHGPNPDAQQRQQRALLDHQHQAEQVGVEARWIGQHLRKQGAAPQAETYEQEGRRAHQTARAVHEQRQQFGAGVDWVQEAARVVRQQDQQKRGDEQQAARGDKSLTSEQRANASADVKQAIEGKERAETVRGTGGAIADRAAQQGTIKAGNSRPVGRGR